MEVDSADSRAAIERDLRCYADQWQKLQEAEAESAYGPVYPETADIQELSRKGSCIFDVTLRRGMDFPPPFLGLLLRPLNKVDSVIELLV